MSLRRHSIATGARDVAPILVGVVPFGLVAGALVIQANLGLPATIGMSVIVFAGASQIVATTLFAEAPDRLRPVLGYFLVDQNYAATMTQGRFRDDVDVIWYYLGAGMSLWIVWQISCITGALVGPFIPASWGLDFAVPLVFLAMLAPTLTNSTSVGVAVVTTVTAAIFVPLLPFQSGLVAALVAGMLYGAWRDLTSPDAQEPPPKEEAAELTAAASAGEDVP